MSKLEDDKLWQQAAKIAQEIYSLLDALPEDEKWGMGSKLRGRAVDLSTEVAEAVGSIDPRDKHYYLGHAKRSLFGIKNVYLLAQKTEVLAIQPESFVQLNKLSDALDAKIDKSAKAIPDFMQQYDGRKEK
jgi:four helix bundle protein